MEVAVQVNQGINMVIYVIVFTHRLCEVLGVPLLKRIDAATLAGGIDYLPCAKGNAGR